MRWILLGLVAPTVALAQGINTNAALPVAQGEGIWRSQLRYVHASRDPSPAERKVQAWVAPQTLVVGFTPRLTGFATLPLLMHRRVESVSGTDRTGLTLGDPTLLGRYTLWRDDYAPLSTRRAALLAGGKLPTSTARQSTETFDPTVGGVATWAADRHELDVDALYTISTQRMGFQQGQRLRYDLAYRYRVWPRRFGRRLLQLNALLELNGEWSDRNRVDGDRVAASGGHLLFLSPGIQAISQRWILEASLQLPVVRNLYGARVEPDLVAVLSVRIPFELPH